jgi:solute carrier family 10 (sodium/bile acid cotransporter), member 7
MSVVAGLQAYGNSALALLLCVGSNTIGIVTVPYFLRAMLTGSGAKLDAVALLLKLVVSVLVPLAIGKAILEAAPPVQRFTKRHKTLLKLLNNGSLISIVWQSISRDQARRPPLHA